MHTLRYNPLLDIFLTVGCACTPGLSERARDMESWNEGAEKGFGRVSTYFALSLCCSARLQLLPF